MSDPTTVILDPNDPRLADDHDPTIAVIDAADPMFDHHLIKENINQAYDDVHRRVPPTFKHAVTTIPEIRAWVAELVQRAAGNGPAAHTTSGRSILLVGPVGTGKTHQCYGIIRALAVSGVYCPWELATAADIYARLRPRSGIDSDDEFNRLARRPLLVIDDIGANKPSEWTEEVNHRLINHRYEWQRPTVFTSNLPPADLRAALGNRVSSRIAGMATHIVIGGPDRRRNGE